MTSTQSADPFDAKLKLARETSARLREAIGHVIVGQTEVVDQTLWGMLAGGHVLLEGAPGLGKTLLVRTIAGCLDLQFSRIQFTPDLMPSDVTGTNILVTASDGHQAMRLLESNPSRYDVVILDRAMPGVDGMEVLGCIKENESTEHIPVLMQTARDANQEVVEGLRAGAYYHLTRPYDGEVLKTVVRSAVNNRIHEKSLHESLRQVRWETKVG